MFGSADGSVVIDVSRIAILEKDGIRINADPEQYPSSPNMKKSQILKQA